MHARSVSTLEDQIISGLYRAAAGERPWGDSLADVVRLFNAWGVHLHGVRLDDGSVAFSYEVGPGFTPEGALEYIRRYHRLDPRTALLEGMRTCEWISCHEHFDDAFVAQDPFYRDFLMAYGGRYVSATKVYQDDEVLAFFGIHRGRGSPPLGDDELALGQRIGEHLNCALGLWRRHHRSLQDRVFGDAVINRLAHPVLLIDEHLQIQYRNHAAERLLLRDGRIKERGSSLVCPGTGESELMLTVRQLRLGGERAYLGAGDSVQRAALRAHGGSHREPLLLLFSALRAEEALGVFGPKNLALVLVHDLSERRPIDTFITAAIYDLTPAEALVAVSIAAGRTVKEIARGHGVAVATVRSQLHVVFAKMGVSRQAEIAAVLAAIPHVGAAAPQ